MTFQEKYTELQNDFARKSDAHLKADNSLSKTNGFIDKFEWDEFDRTKKEWQEASNKYYNFLIYFRHSGKSSSDIYNIYETEMRKKEDPITKKQIKIKANQTFEINLPKAFLIEDSMFTIIHNFIKGNIKVKLSNADGHSISDSFNTTIPIIIAFNFYEAGSSNEILNNKDFYCVELTPSEDFEGEFSFGIGYPKEALNIYRKRK